MKDDTRKQEGSKDLESKLDNPLSDRPLPPAAPAYLEQISYFRVDSLEPSEVVTLTTDGETEQLEIKETLRLGNEGITYYTQDQKTGKERGLLDRIALGFLSAKTAWTQRFLKNKK